MLISFCPKCNGSMYPICWRSFGEIKDMSVKCICLSCNDCGFEKETLVKITALGQLRKIFNDAYDARKNHNKIK